MSLTAAGTILFPNYPDRIFFIFVASAGTCSGDNGRKCRACIADNSRKWRECFSPEQAGSYKKTN